LVEDSIITSNSVLHRCIIACLKPTIKTPYSPVSQILDTFLLVTSSNKDRGLRRELPTAGLITMNECSAAADSQVVKCNRFSYQQVIHILPHRKHREVLDFQIGQGRSTKQPPRTAWLEPIPSQYGLIDRCIHNSVQDQPVSPPILRPTGQSGIKATSRSTSNKFTKVVN